MMELIEVYNKDGKCVERSINGVPLSPDKTPSVAIFMECSSITTKSYMTEEEARIRFPKEIA